MSGTTGSTLRTSDYLSLVAYCLVLTAFVFWFDRTLTSHETVGCVNIREMMQSGDWLVPTYGNRPWLERPPLPFWITIPLVKMLGDIPAAYRLAPLLIAIPCVLLTAWMAALWFGRGLGLMAGAILATIREFTHYATGPECDMFLCGVVTLAMALFVYLEFCRRPADAECGFFLGRRPWALLALFVVLGMANLVKGLFFGDLLILLPFAVFLLCGPDRWAVVRRYVWLPGWLAFLVVGSAWAIAVYSRYPDVVELWKHDYLGRYNQGYMREPIWYYLAQLPWVLFPWTFVAGLGLAVSARRAFHHGRTPERFLWCWAIVPIIFLSVPQGKHHHYLLHVMPAWAILSVLGMVRLWEWLPSCTLLQRPWPMLLAIALPLEVAVWYLGQPLGTLYLPVLLVCPILVLAYWWILSRPSLSVAAIALFALLIPLHWVGHASLRLVEDRFHPDLALVAQARKEAQTNKTPLFVLDDRTPLGASWFLFYLDHTARLLHHPSHVLRGDVAEEMYVLMRRDTVALMSNFAHCSLLRESEKTHDEFGHEGFRVGLYHVSVLPHLARTWDPIYISPMQATGRAAPPILQPTTGFVLRP